MLLQGEADAVQLLVDAGILRRKFRNRKRRARPRDHILSLGVHEVFAVEPVFACCGIARKSNARSRRFAHVPEDHRLHVHRRSPRLGDIIHLAVRDRAIVHPRSKHGADRPPKLSERIFGEFTPGPHFDGLLELCDQIEQIVRVQLGVKVHPFLLLLRFDDHFKGIDLILVHRLQPEDHIAVHLDEPAVRVVDEPRILGLQNQARRHDIVETKIQDRVHHPRHRRACTGADGDQKGVLRIAEFRLHGCFHLFQRRLHLVGKRPRIGVLVLVVVRADFRRHGEARRDREAYVGHFRKVCSLASQQVLHFGLPLSPSFAEEIHIFRHS